MSNFTVRVLSAAFVILLMLATYYFYKEVGLYIFGGLAILIGAHEFYNMMIKPLSTSVAIRFSFLVTAILVVLPVQILFSVLYGFMLLPIVLTIILWATRSKIENQKLLQLCFSLTFGVFYCLVFPKLILSVLLDTDGLIKFLGLLVLVFSSDIFAYLGGVTLGKTPLMPKLSPKKTVEGAIFGCVGAAIATFAYYSFFPVEGFSPTVWLIVAFPISFVSQAGDLLMSLIKRVSGVKDSGKIMPGHGGILDRLDAVYFAAPLYAGALILITNASY